MYDIIRTITSNTLYLILCLISEYDVLLYMYFYTSDESYHTPIIFLLQLQLLLLLLPIRMNEKEKEAHVRSSSKLSDLSAILPHTEKRMVGRSCKTNMSLGGIDWICLLSTPSPSVLRRWPKHTSSFVLPFSYRATPVSMPRVRLAGIAECQPASHPAIQISIFPLVLLLEN